MSTALGASLRRVQVGSGLAAFGSGFTAPYLFVYVARVRGLGDGAAGAVMAVFAAVALTVLPWAGRAIDRRGPLPVALAGVASAVAGALGFAAAAGRVPMLGASLLMGAGVAVLQPALATMIVHCSAPAERSRAFASQFFLSNLGLGLGGLVGGLLVDERRPGSFLVLFSVEAVMLLVLAAVLVAARLPAPAPAPGSRAVPAQPAAVRGGGGPCGAWAALARDRAMVLLCVLGFVLFFACYGQFESGLSAYAVEVTRISPATLGTALAANTAAIVLAQFAVLRLVAPHRRSSVVALVGLVWAVAWLAAGASGLLRGAPAAATGLLICTYVLFGLGETLLSPTVAPLVADLAPERLVGRYNAAFALVKQLALAVGPVVGGLLAATEAYAAYIALMVGCALGVSGLSVVLGRRLTPAQDRPGGATVLIRRASDTAAQPELQPEVAAPAG